MKTIPDEEAFALGSRAVNAGLRIVPGMKTLHARNKWTGSIVTGLDYDGTPAVSTGLCEPFSPGNLLPDLRDPGTKGHAVAQLRERTGNPYLNASEYVQTAVVGRSVPMSWRVDAVGGSPHPTEEETIVAAFEATKETP